MAVLYLWFLIVDVALFGNVSKFRMFLTSPAMLECSVQGPVTSPRCNASKSVSQVEWGSSRVLGR